MRFFLVIMCALMLAACSEVSPENAQQAIEAGKQAVEAGKQAVQAGKEIAESEVAQQLKTYLQEKYESSEALRNAMFSGDGQLLAEELKKTELANFSFYQSDLFGVEFKGSLTADGTFKVLKYNLDKPNDPPVLIKEFKVTLDQNGQIQVQ